MVEQKLPFRALDLACGQLHFRSGLLPCLLAEIDERERVPGSPGMEPGARMAFGDGMRLFE